VPRLWTRDLLDLFGWFGLPGLPFGSRDARSTEPGAQHRARSAASDCEWQRLAQQPASARRKAGRAGGQRERGERRRSNLGGAVVPAVAGSAVPAGAAWPAFNLRTLSRNPSAVCCKASSEAC